MAINRLYKKAICTSLFFFIPTLAHAESRSYCRSLPELANGVKDCTQNAYFAKAAQLCLGKLEDEINAQQALLNGVMLLNNASTESAQTARIQNNTNNLSGMQATMDSLEAEARRVRAEVVSYSQNFVYAGPISQAMAERLHLVDYLHKFNCFKDNQAAISEVVGIVDKHITDLQKAAKVAASMKNIDNTNMRTMDASTTSAIVHGRAPSSSGPNPIPSGKSVNQASTITGTKKIDEDKNALKAKSGN